MSIPAFVLALGLLVGCCLTLFKLIQTGLARYYRAFFAFFTFWVIQTGAGLLLGQSSKLYFRFWTLTLPVEWVLGMLVVRELCGLVLERYRGLKTAGRWGMYAGVVIAAAISILTLLPQLKPAQRSRVLPYIFPIERGINFSLAIFLLFMMFLLSRFPVKLSRNVIVHTALYTIFFLSNALNTLVHTFFGVGVPPMVDLSLLAVSAACTWLWFLLLSRKGEEVQMNLPHYTPEQEHRILMKLDALNATMLKVSHN